MIVKRARCDHAALLLLLSLTGGINSITVFTSTTATAPPPWPQTRPIRTVRDRTVAMPVEKVRHDRAPVFLVAPRERGVDPDDFGASVHAGEQQLVFARDIRVPFRSPDATANGQGAERSEREAGVKEAEIFVVATAQQSTGVETE